jgi:ribosomal protein L11 methyltransferase
MELAELRVPVADSELAADRLWAAGAPGIEELALAGDAVAIRGVLGDARADAVARLGELPAGWELHWVDVDDAPSEAWRDHVVPIEIDGPDGLVVRPAWLPPIVDGRTEIAIEPGASFGLGDHPTTQLCLSAVRTLTRPGIRVLDVGCGSGVLGIAALRCGAHHVTAIDVSAAAVEASWSNAVLNGVADRFEASLTPVADVEGTFDLVVANVLAPVIVEMAPDLVRLVGDDGVLVVSGILAAAHDHVVEALAPLHVSRRSQLAAWCAVELRG